MKGAAGQLVHLAPAARRSIAVTAGISVVATVLVVVQAGLLAGLVADAFLGGAGLAAPTPALVALACVVAARALLGWSGEMAAHLDAATAERVCAELLRTTAGRTAIVASHRPPPFPRLPQPPLPA